MIITARTLQPQRAASGHHVLFSEFRENPDAPETKRVENILSLLVTANSELEHARRPVTTHVRAAFIQEVRKRQAAKNTYLETLDRLTKALERYHWQSTITGTIEGFGEQLTWHTRDNSALEQGLVRILLDLTKMPGEIARFRHCIECQQWFYAATSHQRFCGDACRRRHTASSPDFKEKRRRYMQQVYRPQQKQRERESLALAKRTAKKVPGGK